MLELEYKSLKYENKRHKDQCEQSIKELKEAKIAYFKVIQLAKKLAIEFLYFSAKKDGYKNLFVKEEE